MIREKVPKKIISLLIKLNKLGKTYLVGGAVRDLLMGIKPNDFDLATELNLQELLVCFPKAKIIGKKKYEIIEIKEGEFEIQIARFREDKKCDGKHAEVSFVKTIEEDLARRDFTMNAIAWSPKEGLIDPFNGLKDIKEKRIKFVGEWRKRLQEDYSRILRYVSFRARFDLKPSNEHIVTHLSTEIEELQKNFIKNVSKEQYKKHLDYILLSKKPSRYLKWLKMVGLLEIIIPKLKECYDFDQQNKHHDKDVFKHLLAVIDNTKNDLETRWAALLHDVCKPDCFTFDGKQGHFFQHDIQSAKYSSELLRELGYNKEFRTNVNILISNHMSKSSKITDKANRRFLLRLQNIELLEKEFDLMRADILGSIPPFNFYALDNLIKKSYELYYNKEEKLELEINGKEIMEILNLKPGKKIGEIKKELFELILEDPTLNKKETLKKLVLKWKN